MREICVVHLVWAPLGLAPLERFAASYRRHPAGTDHRLMLVFKQFRDGESLAEAERVVADLDYERLEMRRRKLDLPAYRAIAEALPSRRFLFLNSSSELLGDDWLAKLDGCLDARGVGLVGATGSYESQVPSSGPMRPVRALSFPPFPNPHVRTNAFMIDRSLMLSLRWPKARTKTGAWKIENGRRSITRQICARGLETLVVGRDGIAYDVQAWPRSRTFRSGEQENLLIADNRTREFIEAPAPKRRWLAELAWGEVSTRVPQELDGPATDRGPELDRQRHIEHSGEHEPS
jgi:hypothetical protein